MQFQSTFKCDPPTTHRCVVYDRRDGRIVLVHDFIGDGMTGVFGPVGREERERIVLHSARQRFAEPQHLHVLHVSPDFHWDQHSLYRVDVNSGALEVRCRMPQRERFSRHNSGDDTQ